MKRPLLLDLFCGAGGAAVGYHRAGFDVIGVDIEPQPHFPFEFHQADAVSILRGMDNWPNFNGELWRPSTYAAIHASPPCQDHTKLYVPEKHGTGWMLAAAREHLESIGLPWVIENVPGAPMRVDVELCGCMFGLGSGERNLYRPRWFETSWRAFSLRPPCHHKGRAITVAGHGAQGSWEYEGGAPTQDDRKRAMGIDWMNRNELGQAIPPAFTEHVGGLLMDVVAARAAA